MTHDDQSKDDNAGQGPMPQWAAFVSMGISSAVIVALGVVLGIMADSALNSSPLLLFVGIFLGCGLAVLSAIVQVKRFL
jgi:F0F1-type ATP synthase assembly protein I